MFVVNAIIDQSHLRNVGRFLSLIREIGGYFFVGFCQQKSIDKNRLCIPGLKSPATAIPKNLLFISKVIVVLRFITVTGALYTYVTEMNRSPGNDD